MPKVVKIKADGTLSIVIDDFSVVTSVDDPLLPSSLSGDVLSAFHDISAQGISELHMEQDAFRTFTHTVKGGMVSSKPDITSPAFSAIVSASQGLEVAYGFALLPQENESVPTEEGQGYDENQV